VAGELGSFDQFTELVGLEEKYALERRFKIP
jgi:hypothetical protein